MTEQNIQKIYEQAGGEFYSPPVLISEKLKKIKALVFDWDGVFHGGKKNGDGSSSFSEADSMGINMLRFGFFLQNGVLPLAIIVTGEQNSTAQKFAQREHFDAVFYKAKDKSKALDVILAKHELKEEEVLFCFDDILDLSMAQRVGVRYLINRKANPVFASFCKEQNMADYRSACTGDEHALREVTELSLALMNQFESTTMNRIAFTHAYSHYWSERQQQGTTFFSPNPEGEFQKIEQ